MLRRSQRAFTLIELLTVIAIIALLAAILVPVFSRVREANRQKVCMSNMHDIYVKVHAYKDDTGRYPDYLLGPYQAGKTAQQSSASNGLYPAYIKSIDTFHCPDNTDNHQDASTAAGEVFLPTATPGPSANAYYRFDSYDITSLCLPNGKRSGTQFIQVYSKDWTGATGSTDAPNQMKYTNTVPPDKTLLTMCNYHVTTAGATMCPVILLSGTAKVVDYHTLISEPWRFANR